MTGMTGFFGVWLLDTLAFAKHLDLCNLKVTIVSRNPGRFIREFPGIQEVLSIRWIEEDIRTFGLPRENFDYVIHGATTTASETFYGQSNNEKFSTIVDGTQNLIKQIQNQDSNLNLLYLSSGAVYDFDERFKVSSFDERYPIAPSTLNREKTLGLAKRTAETMCDLANQHNNLIQPIIARCFSFIGAYLPLNIHYAIGNFIHHGLKNEPIILRSKGESIRSFMYMSDCITWMIKSLNLKSRPDFPLHFGSEENYSINEIANKVARTFNVKVKYESMERLISPAGLSYIPNTLLTRNLIGINSFVDFNTALDRTISDFRNKELNKRNKFSAKDKSH
jgi:dTDP-glucose 4,6-dehydratase/UDP-glucose 4-epimerase